MLIAEYKDGYLPIKEPDRTEDKFDVDRDTLSKYETHEGLTRSFDFGNGLQTAPLIPVGQIALTYWNEECAKLGNQRIEPGDFAVYYKDGDSTQLPFLLYNPFVSSPKKAGFETLSEACLTSRHYLKASFFSIQKENVILYDVQKIEDLYSRDRQKMLENKISATQCKGCNHMFINKTTGRYCSTCKQNKIPGKINAKAYRERTKTDRTLFHKMDIRDRRKTCKKYTPKHEVYFKWQEDMFWDLEEKRNDGSDRCQPNAAEYAFKMNVLCSLYEELSKQLLKGEIYIALDMTALKEWKKTEACFTEKKPYGIENQLPRLEQCLKIWCERFVSEGYFEERKSAIEIALESSWKN